MMAPNPTPAFRVEAMLVALTSGLPRKQVAADFGIGFSTLSRWIQQDRRNPEKPTVQSDLERCALRRGNVHSADGSKDVLAPVIARYKTRDLMRFFCADAAFAIPDLYEML